MLYLAASCPTVLQLAHSPTWVGDVGALSACSAALLRCPALGVDAEWTSGGALGKRGTQLSCISFASEDETWVLEGLPGRGSGGGYDAALSRLLDQLLVREGGPTVVAWAFAGDAEIIERRMITTAAASAETAVPSEAAPALRHRMLATVVDVQPLAIAHGVGSQAQMPSLRAACEAFLGAGLAKDQQNSAWDERPLRDEQLRYAALDALAPLQLWKRLRQDPP